MDRTRQLDATPGARSAQFLEPAAVGAGATDSYRLCLAFLLVMFAAVADVPNVFDRGGAPIRYVLLLIPTLTLVVIRLREPSTFIRSPRVSDAALAPLWLFGMIGTAYAMGILGERATALSVFLPMTLAFSHLLVIRTPTEREINVILRALSGIGALYIVLGAAVNVVFPATLAELNQFRNAALMFAALGFAGAIVLRRWLLLTVLVVLQAIAFTRYPSATTVLGTIALILTFSMTAPRPTRVRPFVLATLVTMGILLIVVNLGVGITLSSRYFAFVGKNDANTSRLQAWSNGVERFQRSPIVGSVFTEPGVVVVQRPRGTATFQIPFHNDYIFLLAGGGLLGLALFLAWASATEVTALDHHRRLIEAGQMRRAALLRVLLAAFNVFLVSAAFNGALGGMSRSASVFSLYAMMMIVSAPAARASE